ncbi:MAG: hypothetical protein J5W83_15235 [Candidatus Accumulibacter sp.]|uniref:hypothetical protein n=1 Tax=Accumulibacter sp. TaxID=2053492 RepID=UPI001B17143D|nr:hypothetical protein [Accumulibacter sp.]MBO3703864.1 hypothetical protein [Accumulibacter sp.]
MKTSFLDFEQPIADLEGKIEALRFAQDDSAVDTSDEIGRLEQQKQARSKCCSSGMPRSQFGRGSPDRLILAANILTICLHSLSVSVAFGDRGPKSRHSCRHERRFVANGFPVAKGDT